MSPEAGCLLVEHIAPRLRITSRCLPQVGADDADELYQDGLAIAARMLDSAERNNKKVTAGNIAWYAGKQLASGRRSTYGGRADVLCPAAQLDGNARFAVLDQDVAHDADSADTGKATKERVGHCPIFWQIRPRTQHKPPLAISTGSSSCPGWMGCPGEWDPDQNFAFPPCSNTLCFCYFRTNRVFGHYGVQQLS
jgi:hypothetical protein